ncbi:polyprotein [Pleioblastus mosaic virus]|uniref:Genome polyprotein n=1 Tax=Pleioblastus mosaic virus TaxID=2760003 RepID=A0ABM7LJG5_9POTV|nr:polyprotein [Pleioblastus mosaic virus]BCJ04103.1 polyprotein [Pleioblastus mosaic virus]
MAGEWCVVESRRMKNASYDKKMFEAQRRAYERHQVYNAERALEHNTRLCEKLGYTFPQRMASTQVVSEPIKTKQVWVRKLKVVESCVQVCKSKSSRAHRMVVLTATKQAELTKILLDQCAVYGKICEVIGNTRRRATRLKSHRFRGRNLLNTATRHESGYYKRIDSNLPEITRPFILTLCDQFDGLGEEDLPMIKRGDSGLTFRHPIQQDLFVVRGRSDGTLMNALDNIDHKLNIIDYYTSNSQAEKFWNGFATTYVNQRRNAHDHTTHNTDIPLEECGKRVAILENIFHQSFRLNCSDCLKTYDGLTQEEVLARIHEAIVRLEDVNKAFIEKDLSLGISLGVVKSMAQLTHTHHDNCLEIMKTLDPTLPTPANRVCEIAKLLIQSKVHDDSFLTISQNLLEVARWISKRARDSHDDLQGYKNKVPPRGVIGNVLACDNQLDNNGNFLWGQRAYHAKRFLSNFYEVVDPNDEYDKHVIRRTPNSQRHLAIGKLIVVMDLERMRERMRGLPLVQSGITQACISKLNGNIVYPCSCVTQDSGKPLWSELVMPTKEHISLGNTADPHLVDLPKTDPPTMYIVKDGYCYLNIFLAMLIYVNEDAAKSFTKFIRDRIQPMLREWPKLKDVATACYLIATFYPETLQAEIPKILIDHDTKTAHVLDTFGSLTTNYHVLKANTVAQLIRFAYNDLQSEIKDYIVGGDLLHTSVVHILEHLVKGIFDEKKLASIIEEDPFLLILAIESPCVLMNMYNNGNFERVMQYYSTRNMDYVNIFAAMESFAKKVSTADIFAEQLQIMEDAAADIHAKMATTGNNNPTARYIKHHLMVMMNRADMNQELRAEGHTIFDSRAYEIVEKKYIKDIELAWTELNWFGKLRVLQQLYYGKKQSTKCIKPKEGADFGGIYNISPMLLVSGFREKFHTQTSYISTKLLSTYSSVKHVFRGGIIKTAYRCMPDMLKMMHVAIVMSCISTIIYSVCATGSEYKRFKRESLKEQIEREEEMTIAIHAQFMRDQNFNGTQDAFLQFISDRYPELLTRAICLTSEEVEHQKKSYSEMRLEQVIAFATLITMLYDAERSDAVFKILQKIRSCTSIISREVEHQGTQIDEPQMLKNLKNLTVDFEVSQEIPPLVATHDTTFEKWWNVQITQGRTASHYRNKGEFIQFTRGNALAQCNKIAHMSGVQHFLIRGNVGSGKSTGLPRYLSEKGKILVLEPTRPLTENVFQQLKNEPWCLDPTMQMRGRSVFGSTPITIMTTGFALHMFANNIDRLNEYQFIMFDECHVVDANAMAFSCLLEEYKFSGKILSVSATPPGKESEFETEKPVDLRVFEDVTFDTFVSEQGTGSKLDATAVCDSILIYVASYNEVDLMSRLLNERGFTVTKVDGRTMNGSNKSNSPIDQKTHVNIDDELQHQIGRGRKHFIVATNIIENGVTLNVDGVVDFGTKVVADLDVDNRAITYQKTPISYGERVQRLGRVGRFKKGYAFRIGTTKKGILEIPSMTATEAAFLCFAYGLPVITHNVSTTHLSNVTTLQARTMLQFEMPIFFMSELVKFDGHMHPAIHAILKPFKLRDSSISLRDTALPQNASDIWLTVGTYKKLGYKFTLPDDCKLPYYVNGVSSKIYEQVWDAVKTFRSSCCMRRMTSSCAGKIAYTLQTDIHAIPRTLAIIDGLIREEQVKHSHFLSISSNTTSSYNFTLNGLMDMLKSRYMKDHSVDNIQKLEMVKNQIIEYSNANVDLHDVELIKNFGSLQTVVHESKEALVTDINLQGVWNKELMCKDGIISFGVALGGILIGWECYKHYFHTEVEHQAKSKRSRQKLRFRDARDTKHGRVEYGDDGTVDQHFSRAFDKKEKKGNKSRQVSEKTRRFTHVYGFDPTEYNMIRFVDPLTGTTLDETTQPDMQLVKEHFNEMRESFVLDDKLDRQKVYKDPGIHAYFIKNSTNSALKVDLTLHNPNMICKSKIEAGFPEYEFELRQTGLPQEIERINVPKPNEPEVEHEGVSTLRGVANYNPIADNICILQNESDGHIREMYGIGHGPFVIVPSHLFEHNNGTLTLRSTRGLYKIINTCTLQVLPIEQRDILVIRLPKDHPPFTQAIQFAAPNKLDRVLMLRMNFQQNKNIVEFSESSITVKQNDSFWKHWIATKSGYCGLPLVNTRTKEVVGIHSLGAIDDSVNYFTSVNQDLIEKLNMKLEQIHWVKGWKYNMNLLSWDGLHMRGSKPSAAFRTMKEVTVSNEHIVSRQADTWLSRQFNSNLIVVGSVPGNLVTKHVVKGKCQLFQLYLSVDTQAKSFFEPLLGKYGKSLLNRQAFVRDFTKYDKPIVVGNVQTNQFEIALDDVTSLLRNLGIWNCNYVTIPDEIYNSMNMKAAVGALYHGKKKDYFEGMSSESMAELLKASCERLYTGKMGVWNGSLKAEIRPMEKILENKTRTFTAAPLETLLGGKVCVDDFNNQFYNNHLKGPWTVGISKFYRGWDELLSKLPNGWIYCDADGSQFDSSLSPYLLNSVLRIRLACMEDWELGEQMLRNLYTEIVYTPIATPDGSLVKKFKGNNSGQPSTVVDNTLMVILAFKYALRVCNVHEHEESDVIMMFGNGDDLLIAVNPDYEYLLDTMGTHFADLGLNFDFTNRTKDKAELWFMSHRGLLYEGVYIPKLEPERIAAILEWDRSVEPEHRLSAICAAIIEAWGYDDLIYQIRRFYQWVLEQEPYKELAAQGKAPYLSETALRKLYLDSSIKTSELMEYYNAIYKDVLEDVPAMVEVEHQSGEGAKVDAGGSEKTVSDAAAKTETPKSATAATSAATAPAAVAPKASDPPTVETQAKGSDPPPTTPVMQPKVNNTSTNGSQAGANLQVAPTNRDRDVDAGSVGTFTVPRLKKISQKMRLPKIGQNTVLNIDHLLTYKPDQRDLSNARASHMQFKYWYDQIKKEYDVDDEQMKVIMNGLMVWAIENGTSPNINGHWHMMDGDEQIEYPLKPVVEYAKPTLRQCLMHFSDAAEAYIELRNTEEPYMPRYGLLRNLNDRNLARYAFDFYEMNSRTPSRAREAHIQMKAAAIRGATNDMFGLDGNVGEVSENTERHVATDVTKNTHSYRGVKL